MENTEDPGEELKKKKLKTTPQRQPMLIFGYSLCCRYYAALPRSIFEDFPTHFSQLLWGCWEFSQLKRAILPKVTLFSRAAYIQWLVDAGVPTLQFSFSLCPVLPFLPPIAVDPRVLTNKLPAHYSPSHTVLPGELKLQQSLSSFFHSCFFI